jgi:2,3-bisphosphoglycerate-dependent phosphoglycerate mutase
MKKIFLILIFCSIVSFTIQAQETSKIWIVRHAEKQSEKADPALTPEGEKRAKSLAKYLKKEKVAYVFSTNYLRTKQTAIPTAKQKALETTIYDAKDNEALIQVIKNLPKGSNSLIVGHSNTVLVILEMLGALAPIQTLKDDDYDFIFQLTINGEVVKLKTSRYGKKHHSTQIK